MPNPYRFKAHIDQLWRHATSEAPAYRRLKALDAVVRELFAPNDRARLNHQRYLATDPYDVARHLLRDLYDRDPLSPPASSGGRCHGVTEGGSPLEEQPTEEDDDPL